MPTINDKRELSIYLVLGIVVGVYCSHAFGIKPLAKNYHTIKPELQFWYTQTTTSNWYSYELASGDEGGVITRAPSSWDFFVELVIFLSGSLALIRTETVRSNSRNVVLILKSFGSSLCLICAGIILASLNSSSTVVPANSLLVWLGVLSFLGRLLLFLPLRKTSYLVPVGLLFLGVHWTTVQYGFGDASPVLRTEEGVSVEEDVEIPKKSVWQNESGVLQRMSEVVGSVMPMSVRSSGLTTDYANYSEMNLIAYAGLYVLGMAAGCIVFTASSTGWISLQLISLSLLLVCLSVGLLFCGLPAVPRLASATHTLLAGAVGSSLVTCSVILLAVKSGQKFCLPLIAMGAGSALLYLLERAFGVAFRTEVDKHLEPLFEPIFGDLWLKWEPIVFYNIVFLFFAAFCIYLYRKKIGFSF